MKSDSVYAVLAVPEGTSVSCLYGSAASGSRFRFRFLIQTDYISEEWRGRPDSDLSLQELARKYPLRYRTDAKVSTVDYVGSVIRLNNLTSQSNLIEYNEKKGEREGEHTETVTDFISKESVDLTEHTTKAFQESIDTTNQVEYSEALLMLYECNENESDFTYNGKYYKYPFCDISWKVQNDVASVFGMPNWKPDNVNAGPDPSHPGMTRVYFDFNLIPDSPRLKSTISTGESGGQLVYTFTTNQTDRSDVYEVVTFQNVFKRVCIEKTPNLETDMTNTFYVLDGTTSNIDISGPIPVRSDGVEASIHNYQVSDINRGNQNGREPFQYVTTLTEQGRITTASGDLQGNRVTVYGGPLYYNNGGYNEPFQFAPMPGNAYIYRIITTREPGGIVTDPSLVISDDMYVTYDEIFYTGNEERKAPKNEYEHYPDPVVYPGEGYLVSHGELEWHPSLPPRPSNLSGYEDLGEIYKIRDRDYTEGEIISTDSTFDEPEKEDLVWEDEGEKVTITKPSLYEFILVNPDTGTTVTLPGESLYTTNHLNEWGRSLPVGIRTTAEDMAQYPNMIKKYWRYDIITGNVTIVYNYCVTLNEGTASPSGPAAPNIISPALWEGTWIADNTTLFVNHLENFYQYYSRHETYKATGVYSVTPYHDIKGNMELTFTWNNLPVVCLSPIASIVLSIQGLQISQEIQPVNIQDLQGGSLTSSFPVVENYYSMAQTLRDLHDELVVAKDTFDDTPVYNMQVVSGQDRTITLTAYYITKNGNIYQIYIPSKGVFSVQLIFKLSYYFN
jgi:hypothetical protein